HTQLQRRHFEIRRKENGMVSGHFELAAMAGETLIAAVDGLMSPPADADNRSPSQRRADALEDLARTPLDQTSPAIVGGERPHLVAHVDLDAIRGEAGGLHETATGEVLDISVIRQIACDTSVSRVVFGPESEILDFGRKTRVISTGLRRAVVARDRNCTWNGCTRPNVWCDVHHIVHWADGGETNLDNLELLCRYHHTLTHNQPLEDELRNSELLRSR
ncbi:MAG: DUF222 domain-containing protein, partial [Acidimicrobiia bacterium]